MANAAVRQQAGGEHRVPLSDRAIAVLDEARRELPEAGNLVFPSEKGRMQGHHPMGKMMKALEIAAVPHGFRSRIRYGGFRGSLKAAWNDIYPFFINQINDHNVLTRSSR